LVTNHHYTDTSPRVKSGHAGQVDGRLGLPRPNEHAPLFGPQWEYMPGTRQVPRPRSWIDAGEDRARAVGRGDSRGHTESRIHRFTKSCAEIRRILWRDKG